MRGTSFESLAVEWGVRALRLKAGGIDGPFEVWIDDGDVGFGVDLKRALINS